MRIHRPAGVLIVSLGLLFAACDELKLGGTATLAPSPFGPPAPFAGASLHPATIGFTSVPAFRCPSIEPFFSTFSLFVDRRSSSDIFMDHVVFEFVDGAGRRSPLQLTRGELTSMFGTTLVAGGATRTFHFSPRFGCGFSSLPTLLVVDLSFLNRSGSRHRSTLTASVR